MVKKGFNIMMAVWLIIALVFCHPLFAERSHPQFPATQTTLKHSDNSLLDVFLNHVMAKKSHKKEPHKKVLAKIRFVPVRVANLDVNLPQTSLFDFADEVERVCFSRFKFWVRKVFLPPHHNFLFRLSPF